MQIIPDASAGQLVCVLMPFDCILLVMAAASGLSEGGEVGVILHDGNTQPTHKHMAHLLGRMCDKLGSFGIQLGVSLFLSNTHTAYKLQVTNYKLKPQAFHFEVS